MRTPATSSPLSTGADRERKGWTTRSSLGSKGRDGSSEPTSASRSDTERYAKTWWGEGEVKIYLDGDSDYPTLCGTGTEDYAGTAWDLKAPYSTPFQGCPLVDFDRQEFGFYRFHVPDPVFFREISG